LQRHAYSNIALSRVQTEHPGRVEKRDRDETKIVSSRYIER
jgi:hypothetical protein